ncbi:cysteine methyltransferase [candidate division KSB1 bacterium 4484_87]|nr:MAG: cysteine methyltransferase [candidate division KSB1 bacterium 4484_87]
MQEQGANKVLYYDSPIGMVEIVGTNEMITGIYFRENPTSAESSNSPALIECRNQLIAYFTGKLQKFDLPLSYSGTDFQMQVWNALREIPYGETISYSQLAQRINRPKAVRAVGGANHRNPISIVVPCHRVIGADGKMVGYGGGLWRKVWLLEHEKKYK